MVGVGYGKGASVDESQVRWATPEELELRRSSAEKLWLLDARDQAEHELGTIPGAISLAQTDLMFRRHALQGTIDEIISANDVILFANTAGPNSGITAGRDVWVMAFLHELGKPMAQMARLRGGFRGWQDAGMPVEFPGPAQAPLPKTVDELLTCHGLVHLQQELAGESLQQLVERCRCSRPDFLQWLKELGIQGVAQRQQVANALAKEVRRGLLDDFSPMDGGRSRTGDVGV